MAKPHKLKDGRYECQNCLGKFTKKPQTYIDPLFCSDPCRKEFHATGGMSLKRIETKVEKFATATIQNFVADACAPLALAVEQLGVRIAALEARRNGHR